MSIRGKGLLLPLLTLIAGMPAAHAQFAVIDIASVTQLITEVQTLQRQAPQSTSPEVKDLRSLLWSSIDNETSRDLDQIEFAGRNPDGSYRLLIGIADVDSLVPKSSKIDDYAASETTSVYTGVITFPMLPLDLSTNLTSLIESQDRASIVIELQVLSTGVVQDYSVYSALTRNYAKLAYPSVGAWLEGRGEDMVPGEAPRESLSPSARALRRQTAHARAAALPASS